MVKKFGEDNNNVGVSQKKKKRSKRFMEGTAHNPHMSSSNNKDKSDLNFINADKRVHYGSGHMSDYHSSIQDSKKRFGDKRVGGSLKSANTRVF